LPRPAHVLLYGDLGAGKTALTKGLVAGFGGDPDDVSSPTFTLVNRYAVARHPGTCTVFHVDLYRVESGAVAGLDLESALDDPTAAVIVEWAERLGESAPGPAVLVFLRYVGPSERSIEVQRTAPNR
jgi:tRNA threonylcarbamoyladenosine biosynthesis protein TsaE